MKYFFLIILTSMLFEIFAENQKVNSATTRINDVLNNELLAQKLGFLNDYIISAYDNPQINSETAYTPELMLQDVVTYVAKQNKYSYEEAKSMLLADLVLTTYQQLDSFANLCKRAIQLQQEINMLGGSVDKDSDTYKVYNDLKALVEGFDLSEAMFELDNIFQAFVPSDFILGVNHDIQNLTELDQRWLRLQAVIIRRSAGVIKILNTVITKPEDRIDLNLAKTASADDIVKAFKKVGVVGMVQKGRGTEKQQYDLLYRIFNKTTQAKLNFLAEYIAMHLGQIHNQELEDPELANQQLGDYIKNFTFTNTTSQEMINTIQLGYLLEICRRIYAEQEYVETAVRVQILVNENGGKLNPASDEYKQYRELQSKLDDYYEAVFEGEIPLDSIVQSFAPMGFVPSRDIEGGAKSALHMYLRTLAESSQRRIAEMIALQDMLLDNVTVPLSIDHARSLKPSDVFRIIKANIVQKYEELGGNNIIQADVEYHDAQ